MIRVKANYTYTLNDNQLAIIDLNLGNMSVTNCIEDVVEEISLKENVNPNNLIIVYRDSEYVWDGWNHKTQNFIGLNCATQEAAFKKRNIR